jgi:hypothetical protein
MLSTSRLHGKYRRLTACLAVAGAVGLCAGASSQDPSPAAHWAFKPPVRPSIPKVKNASWVRNPIDTFILSRLEAKKLSPSPPADRQTLIRRVTFDLTGLPPTPEETAAFVSDKSPGAYEKLVKRLLGSPRFGERWAQHWLDVVRFAESNGYEHDDDRPQAWRYRDWVVNALNADKPYGRFLQEQVAGDLLAPDDFDAHVATGFLRTGPFHVTVGNLDKDEMRQEWLTEAVGGIGNGVLGLTIGCARCHDHKYDPLSQKEYYRLQAFFTATTNHDMSRASEAEKKQFEEVVKANKERKKPIETQIAEIEKPYRDKLRAQKMERLAPEYKAVLTIDAGKRTAEQKKLAGEANTQLNISWDEVVNALSPEDRTRRAALRQQLFAIERELPRPLPEAQGVGEVLKPAPPMRLLVRGEVHNPGEEVQPGLPACVPAVPVADYKPAAEKPRIELARWLTASDNPLTSRVLVNRLWHYLFGRGLVSTPNDFGRNGQPPTNPELLDWLAATFTAQRVPALARQGCGWSIKSMIFLIVTSNTYRQSSLFDEEKALVDPDNHLLWRMNRKRLDAEALRDSILATVGTVNLEVGGPSVRVPLEPEVYDTIFTEYEPDNLWPPTPDPRQHTRRSLYLFRKRNVRLPMLTVFDQPDMMMSCAARGQTVHALQALTLVNSEFMRKQSFLLAKRLCADVPTSQRGRIDRLFALALGHSPGVDELRSAETFLADQTALLQERLARKESVGLPPDTPPGVNAASYRAWADLCLATLNRNDFVFVR